MTILLFKVQKLKKKIMWLRLKIEKDVFFRFVTSVRQRKKIVSSHEERTSDLRILRSDALPPSHRDSTVSGVYYEVHMTRLCL